MGYVVPNAAEKLMADRDLVQELAGFSMVWEAQHCRSYPSFELTQQPVLLPLSTFLRGLSFAGMSRYIDQRFCRGVLRT